MNEKQVTAPVDGRNVWIPAGAAFSAAVAAGWLILLVVSNNDRVMRTNLLQQTRVAAQILNVQRIKALISTEPDPDNHDYLHLKNQLAAIRSTNPAYRFVYLIGRKTGASDTSKQQSQKVFFLADSEPATSKDCSPPGQIYEDATSDLVNVFDSKTAITEGPARDEWGVWISALVPVMDPQTGGVIAILGTDINAHKWKLEVAANSALPSGIILLSLIVIIVTLTIHSQTHVSPMPVLRRLTTPLAVVLLVLVSGFSVLLIRLHRERIAEISMMTKSEASENLYRLLDEHAGALKMAQDVIINSTVEISAALEARDSSRLKELCSPAFEQLNRHHNLVYFNFLDRNCTVILSFHDSEIHGKTCKHFTATGSALTGLTSAGIEVENTGTVVLRVVRPVFNKDSIVGYMEWGETIDDIMASVSNMHNVQMALFIRKDLVIRENREAFYGTHNLTANWDRFADSVLTYSTITPFPPEADWFAGCADKNVTAQIKFNNASWQVMHIPLPDASGEVIGELLVMHDVSGLNASHRQLMILVAGGAFVLLSGLFGFFFVVLSRADAGILTQQKDLKESRERYHRLFDNISSGVAIYESADNGNDFVFTDFNKTAERMNEVRKEDIVGKSVREIRPGVDQFGIMDVFRRVWSTGIPEHFPARMYSDKNLQRWYENFVYKLPTGEIVAVFDDVTERMQTREALEHERTQLLSIFDGIEEPIYVADIETFEILFANQALKKTFGKELTGGICYRELHGLDSPCPFCTNKIIIKQKPEPYRWEHYNARLNRHFIIYDRIISWSNGRDVRLELAFDITGLKQAAEQQKELQTRLERATRLESLGMLVGGIAHDLNNLFGPLMLITEIVADGIEKRWNPENPNRKETLDNMRIIQQLTQRATTVVSDLVCMGRQGNFKREPVNINNVVEQLLNSMQFQTIRPDVNITTRLTDKELWCAGSESALLRVLSNLSGNAVEAIDGNGSIVISTARITLSAQYTGYEIVPAGDYATIEISDTGCGMDAETLTRMLEPFFSTKKAGKRSGSGLGLSIVHGLVKDHAGFLDVKSAPGRGSTFTVYLPAIEPPARQ